MSNLRSLTVHLPRRQIEALDSEARALGLRRSELIRRIFDSHELERRRQARVEGQPPLPVAPGIDLYYEETWRS